MGQPLRPELSISIYEVVAALGYAAFHDGIVDRMFAQCYMCVRAAPYSQSPNHMRLAQNSPSVQEARLQAGRWIVATEGQAFRGNIW